MMETIEDYIAFYSAIPEDKWCTGVFTTDEGSCCALGHLGEREDAISREDVWKFRSLLNSLGSSDHEITEVNDGNGKYINIGDTPKERVINYLKQLRDGNSK